MRNKLGIAQVNIPKSAGVTYQGATVSINVSDVDSVTRDFINNFKKSLKEEPSMKQVYVTCWVDNDFFISGYANLYYSFANDSYELSLMVHDTNQSTNATLRIRLPFDTDIIGVIYN